MGAEKELQEFRAQEQAKFDAEVASKSQSDPAAELKASTEQQVNRVQQDFEENKDRTVAYISGKVLNVPLRLTETQIQALKSGIEMRGCWCVSVNHRLQITGWAAVRMVQGSFV